MTVGKNNLAPPIRIPEISTPLPPNYVLGRIDPGSGDVQLVHIDTLGMAMAQRGTVGGPGNTGKMQPIPDGDIEANISGATALPIGNTLTAVFDYVLGSTKGMILYRDTSVWKVLAIGSATQVLTVAGGIPSWAAASAGSAPNGMLPLVTGDTTPGNGPFPIADAAGQYIGVPL